MSEVRTFPGRCVTWRCHNPADGPECPEHAAEALPVLERNRNTPEGRTTAKERYRERLATDPAFAERERERKRAYGKARREREPGWNSGASYQRRQKQLATHDRIEV